jgi:hypothetical protein
MGGICGFWNPLGKPPAAPGNSCLGSFMPKNPVTRLPENFGAEGCRVEGVRLPGYFKVSPPLTFLAEKTAGP